MLNRTTTPTAAGPIPPAGTTRTGGQARTRFMSLVQSPLRAGLLRYLGARPYETYDVESLMQTFGRIRMDVANCLRELVNAGVVRTTGTQPVLYQFARPSEPEFARLLEDFLADRPNDSLEDRSPSIQRFREMIGRDEKMMVVFESIRTVSKTDLAVLILGPTGSG
jgi:transcriptional regulator with AAA-type ATPase domain